MAAKADAATPRGWAWIFEHAWRAHPETGERLRLHVADTVLFNEAERVRVLARVRQAVLACVLVRVRITWWERRRG